MQRDIQNVQAVKKPSTKSVVYLTSKFSSCFPSSQWWVSYRNTVGSRSSGFDTVCTDNAPDALLFTYCYLSWEHKVTQKTTKSIHCFRTPCSEYSLHVRWMQCAPMSIKISFESILTPVSLIFFNQYLHTFQISEMHAACLANIILLNYSALKILYDWNLLRDILQTCITSHLPGRNAGTTEVLHFTLRGNL
jgi:hypothetical protein